MEKTLSIAEASANFDRIVSRAGRGESTLLVDPTGAAVAKVVPIAPEALLGRDLAKRWEQHSHLDHEEAVAFANDVEEARAELPDVSDPWD